MHLRRSNPSVDTRNAGWINARNYTGTCTLTDSVGCLSSLDRHSEGISAAESCVEIFKCNYVPPLIVAEWVLTLDVLLLVAVSIVERVLSQGRFERFLICG